MNVKMFAKQDKVVGLAMLMLIFDSPSNVYRRSYILAFWIAVCVVVRKIDGKRGVCNDLE